MTKPGGGPHKIGDLLGKVLARYGCTQTTAQLELEQVWRQAAGERIHKRTRVGSLRRGTLEILVDNSVLLQELESFQKPTLLSKMQQLLEHNKIENLRFRRL